MTAPIGKNVTRGACGQWPPASCCPRCGGMGGWYKPIGLADWDWTTCQKCNGTGER